MSDLARNVCGSFSKSLHERVGEARNFGVNPKDSDWMEKFLILFALEDCQSCFETQDQKQKPVCRFSMGLSKNEMRAKLQTELMDQRQKWLMDKYQKAAAAILHESLVDFSLSNYSLPQAAGDPDAPPMPEGETFELLMIAESEMGTKKQVFEDFLKLPCVDSTFKVMVYKAPKQKKSGKELIAGFERIIKISRKNHDRAEWLFIGLPGYREWVDSWDEPKDLTTQVLYLGPKQDKLVSHDEWWGWPD